MVKLEVPISNPQKPQEPETILAISGLVLPRRFKGQVWGQSRIH